MERKKTWRQKIIFLVRKIKIQKRLSVTFLFVSIFPIIFLGVFAYNTYTNSINDKLTRSISQAVTLVNNNLIIQLQKYQELCGTISTDETVQDSLPVWYSLDTIERRKVAIATDEVLNNKASLFSYVNNVRILNDKRQVVYDLGYDDIPVNRYEEIIDDVEKTSPYDSLRYAKTYRSVDNIVLSRKIYSQYSSSQHLGYVLISLNEKLFSQNVMGGIDLGTGSKLLILDRDGHVVSSETGGVILGQTYPDDSLFQAISVNSSTGKGGETNSIVWPSANPREATHSISKQIDNEKCLVTYVYNESIGWYLVSIVPYSYINSETKSITESLLILSCVLIFFCSIIILVNYSSIVGPIKRINRYCRKVEDSPVNQLINDSSPDEMGDLSRSVEHMVGKIQQLMERQIQDQKRQRELELNMLQSQINPHFLFNTLNTLKWIAVINQVPALSDGISSLSDLLRNTILNKEEKIPIKEEMNNINNYVAIQKIRYGNNFVIEYHLDETLLNHRIPKFILQPMVENSIIHGSYDNGHKITIEIVVRQKDDNIIIEINDNGRGFESIDLTQNNSKLSGIGIQNVDERIKLYYGEEYGLVITSEVGKGTHCAITFPKES